MRRLLWPGSLVLLVVSSLGVWAAMLIVSAGAAQHPWHTRIDLGAGAAGLAAQVTATVTDDQGRPITGATAIARADTGPTSTSVLETNLIETDPGRYVGELIADRPGRYRVKIQVRRGETSINDFLSLSLPME